MLGGFQRLCSSLQARGSKDVQQPQRVDLLIQRDLKPGCTV
jgi:hypothetical protein